MEQTKTQYNTCELVQDLLPLYQDEVCSNASREIVQEHLQSCQECKNFEQRLKNTTMDDSLFQEKSGVLEAHVKKERKKTFLVGAGTALFLMIPTIVCLICNLAIGRGLDWFFIVFTSLLLFASFTVIPLMVSNKKGLWTLCAFSGSLLLLFLVINLYTGENWFFQAAIPCLFGLSVIFLPFVIGSIPLPLPFSNHRGILVMIWDTLLLYLLIFACGFGHFSITNWRIALSITSYSLLFPWSLFLAIRYAKVRWLFKTGLVFIFSGIFLATTNNVILSILGEKFYFFLTQFNLMEWNYYETVNANISFILFLSGIILGFLFILMDLVKNSNRKK